MYNVPSKCNSTTGKGWIRESSSRLGAQVLRYELDDTTDTPKEYLVPKGDRRLKTWIFKCS